MRNWICLLSLSFPLSLLALSASAQMPVDPTRPSGYAAPAGASAGTGNAPLRLTLIRLGQQPLAVINGRSLHVGESIAGERVTAIQPGRVLLAGTQGQRVLPLVSGKTTTPFVNSSIKRPPTL